MLITNQNTHHFVNYSLGELKHQLDYHQFFRANRQFLISFNSISQLSHHFHRKLLIHLTPDIGHEVIVSKEKASKFKEWLNH